MSDDVVEKKEENTKPSFVETKRRGGKDLLILFIFTALITLLMLISQFILGRATTIEVAGVVAEIKVLQLPINEFVNALMYFVLIFGGFEGARSVFKTIELPKGDISKMPPWKMNRLLSYVITIMCLTVIAMLLQSIQGTSTPSYEIEQFGQATAVSLATYVGARTGAKVTEDVSKKPNK